MIWHKPDKTTISKEEFDAHLDEILVQDTWLIDGNYQRTKEINRNQKAIGVFTMVLLFAVVYLIFKYFPLLVDSLGK